MSTRTAFLALIPVCVAVLAAAALPWQAAGDAAFGLAQGQDAAAALAVGIIVLAAGLLLRIPRVAAR